MNYYRKLINTLAQQRQTTPFRVMGITAFHFVPFNPAIHVFTSFSVHGAMVDVSGNKDVIRVLDECGAWHPLAVDHADDQDIICALLNRLEYSRLNAEPA
jgi:hypothetical protein